MVFATVDMGVDTLTVRETAERLGVSTRTVRRYVTEGKLVSSLVQTRYGPTLDIPVDAVERVAGLPEVRLGTSKDETTAILEAVVVLRNMVSQVERMAETQQEIAAQVLRQAEELHQLRDELRQARRSWWAPWRR